MILSTFVATTLLFLFFKYNTLKVWHEAGFARGVLSFSLGAMIALMTEKFNIISKTKGNLSGTIALILIIAIMMQGNKEVNFIMPFVFFALIYIMVFCPELYLNKWLEFRPLVFLGTISYSLYLNHTILIQILHKFVRVKNPSVTTQLLITFLFYLALIILSTLTYRFIEKPFMRYFNKKAIHHPAEAPAHARIEHVVNI